MTQLYWQVYNNLEQEFLSLSEIIFIDDSQQNVYSMRIADLLIRTVIEIEALSKELYLENSGTLVPDEEMYFDTVCIKYLNDLWKLDKKLVYVVSPNIYFKKEDNKVLRPMHKAMRRGTSSSDWNKAYQAVKHNRVKDLSKGNIKHLLHGLSALYLLNLYYNDKKIENIPEKDRNSINRGFGSSLFSVKIHKVNGLNAEGKYIKNSDYDECVYIEDHEKESKERAIKAIVAMNDYINKSMEKRLVELIKEKVSQGMPVSQEWIEEAKPAILRQLLPIKDYKLAKQISDDLGKIHYDIVLNKHQY
jgi:hypothetical protein